MCSLSPDPDKSPFAIEQMGRMTKTRMKTRKIKPKTKIKPPLECRSNPGCHSMTRHANRPQFVCMLYSPGSSSYGSTPRNFDDVSHFPDGPHSRTSSHFVYPDQQLNFSSRNPHPLSQSGQINNPYSNQSAFHEYPSHPNQRSQFNNSSSYHQEYYHSPRQNDQRHDYSSAPFSQSTSNQHHRSNFNTAFSSTNDPLLSDYDSFQPEINLDSISSKTTDRIPETISFPEPINSVSQAVLAITLPWMTNPYAHNQLIDNQMRVKLEANVESIIDHLLHEPEFLRTLLPRMQSLFSLPAPESSQQIAKARPVVENPSSQSLPSASRINNRPPDLSLHSQSQYSAQVTDRSNVIAKQQPSSNDCSLSPFVPILHQVPESSNDLPLYSQSQNPAQSNAKPKQPPTHINKEPILLPDLISLFDSALDPNPIPSEDSSHATWIVPTTQI